MLIYLTGDRKNDPHCVPIQKTVMVFIKSIFFLAELQRSHVYHITFPSDWKTVDITNIFSPMSKLRNFFENMS